jgi:hypothetical protein
MAKVGVTRILVGMSLLVSLAAERNRLLRENAFQRLRSDLPIGILRLRMNAFQALMLRSG